MNLRVPDESKSPQFSTQYAPCIHFQSIQFCPRLQCTSPSAWCVEQAGEGHAGMSAAPEMGDSKYACTSKSGFLSLSCCFLLNLLSESCANLLRVACIGIHAFSSVQPYVHGLSGS